MSTQAHNYTTQRYEDIRGPRAGLRAAMRAIGYRFLKDGDLVQRARARDHAAFEALAARYQRQIDQLALESSAFQDSTFEDPDENALTESVLAAFRDIDSFAIRCRPGTWLYLHGLRAVFERLGVGPERRPAARRTDVRKLSFARN